MLDGILPDNDFFKGGLGLALLGGIIAALRGVPALITNAIRRTWSVTMTTRDKRLIRWIAMWLAESEYGANCRWLDGATAYLDGGAAGAMLWPGIGFHSFKYDGRRFWLWHQLEDQGVAGKTSILIIQTLGRKADPIRKLMAQASAPSRPDGT